MDKLAALKAYVAVVEDSGFAAAARRLGQSRSAVNRLVINLEHALEAQLLNRTTRSVAPTASGRAFYERAKSILDQLEEAGQVILRYVSPDGELDPDSREHNPNGSARGIAGIANAEGNVLGMMPHPERCAEEILGSTDGLPLFAAAAEIAAQEVRR